MGGLFGGDVASVAGHVGLHIARVQNRHGDALVLQVHGEGFAGGVEAGLADAVAVLLAGIVIGDGAHARGHQAHLGAVTEVIQQGMGDPQRAQGIHFELLLDLLEVHVLQGFALHHAGVVVEHVHAGVAQFLFERLHVLGAAHVDALANAHAQIVQVFAALLHGGRAAHRDNVITARFPQARHVIADATVGAGDYDGLAHWFRPCGCVAMPDNLGSAGGRGNPWAGAQNRLLRSLRGSIRRRAREPVTFQVLHNFQVKRIDP